MISDIFNYDELRNSPGFSSIKTHDWIYRGQIKDSGSGKRDGYGVILYKTGRLYEG